MNMNIKKSQMNDYLIAVFPEDIAFNNKQNKKQVVVFTMNGCGYCTRIKPIMNEVIKDLQQKGQVYPIVELIYNHNRDFVQKLKINGFPHVRVYNGDTFREFSGLRPKEAIVDFILDNKK